MPSKPLTQQQVDRLLEAARAAQQRAHAPYSKFLVGAAVLDEQDRVHAGCNVENAAYPLGTCAEAGAIAALVLNGGKHVLGLAVVGDGDNPVTPCGGCRQRLREFAQPDTPVIVADGSKVRAQYTLEQLLPHSFSLPPGSPLGPESNSGGLGRGSS